MHRSAPRSLAPEPPWAPGAVPHPAPSPGDVLSSFCRQPPASLPRPVLGALTLSTAMRCAPQGGCSLLLRVQASLRLQGEGSPGREGWGGRLAGSPVTAPPEEGGGRASLRGLTAAGLPPSPTESLRGLEACAQSMDTQQTRCQGVRVPRAARRRQQAGQEVRQL